MPETREVIRCQHCGLNQFKAGKWCRRCRQPFATEPEAQVTQITPATAKAAFQQISERLMPIDIGGALRLVRHAKGMSQSDVAKNLGAPRTYVSKLETGKNNPTLDSLQRFADALDVTPYVLVRIATL